MWDSWQIESYGIEARNQTIQNFHETSAALVLRTVHLISIPNEILYYANFKLK